MTTIPSTGRICIRTTSSGRCLVGVLHLNPGVIVEEGPTYALSLDPKAAWLSSLDNPVVLSEQQKSWGVGDVMTRPVWNTFSDDNVWSIRCLEAFPDSNIWTVYGVHPKSFGGPTHAWLDINNGVTTPIAPPLDAAGMGIGQILTQDAVWPGPNGVLHSVPQIHAPWRTHMHHYHQLLSSSVTNPKVRKMLSKIIASDIHFRELSISQPDPEFCRFLANLESLGGLVMDTPKTKEQLERQHALAAQCIRQPKPSQDQSDGMDQVPHKGPRLG